MAQRDQRQQRKRGPAPGGRQDGEGQPQFVPSGAQESGSDFGSASDDDIPF
jgi:hypothetical protein